MRAISREINDKGHVTLTCEKSYLFGLVKLQERYLYHPKRLDGWKALPNKTTVQNKALIHQLDSWSRDFD